jgi:hypothetical protein
MTPEEWTGFLASLPAQEQRFIALKQAQATDESLTDEAIAQTLGWTSKKVNRTWSKMLKQAWNYRNQSRKGGEESEE